MITKQQAADIAELIVGGKSVAVITPTSRFHSYNKVAIVAAAKSMVSPMVDEVVPLSSGVCIKEVGGLYSGRVHGFVAFFSMENRGQMRRIEQSEYYGFDEVILVGEDRWANGNGVCIVTLPDGKKRLSVSARV